MDRTIFSRGLYNHMEGWNSMHVYPGRAWMFIMRQCALKQPDSQEGLKVMCQPDPYRTPAREIFSLTPQQTNEYNRRATAVDYVTGAPRHLAFYLTLVAHGLLDNFINAYKGAINATQQT